MTIHHLHPTKSINTRVWLAEVLEAAAKASGIVVMALYDDGDSQELRISFCNLNEQELTWVAAKLDDYVAAERRGDGPPDEAS